MTYTQLHKAWLRVCIHANRSVFPRSRTQASRPVPFLAPEQRQAGQFSSLLMRRGKQFSFLPFRIYSSRVMRLGRLNICVNRGKTCRYWRCELGVIWMRSWKHHSTRQCERCNSPWESAAYIAESKSVNFELYNYGINKFQERFNNWQDEKHQTKQDQTS